MHAMCAQKNIERNTQNSLYWFFCMSAYYIYHFKVSAVNIFPLEENGYWLSTLAPSLSIALFKLFV